MRIAIIGGGLTGLTAAYELLKCGHKVTVFEKESALGGLTGGFRQKGWDWHLEKSYHHFFTNDNTIIRYLHELGLWEKIIIKRPITATLMPDFKNYGAGSVKNFRRTTSELRVQENFSATSAPNRIFQLDSPMHLLRFPFLSPIDKVRTAALLAFLKLNPFWQPLENVTAENFFKTIGGAAAWKMLWEPLMRGKFGDLSKTVAASWLAARIKKRTPRLGYINGGFQTLVEALADAIRDNGGKIYTNVSINSIRHSRLVTRHGVNSGGNPSSIKGWIIGSSPRMTKAQKFNAILLTVPTPIAAKLADFPASFIQPLLTIPHLHAQTLILETKTPILKDTYWLNVSDRSFPFLAAVAHTNFMDKAHYGGHHLTYFGNYLPQGHPYLLMNKKQLLKIFLPYIQRLNPSFHLSDLYICHLFIGYFAQPVHQLHYSKRAPALQTPIPNVFLANLDSIYPWDRGTNYAMALGKKAAQKILSSKGS